MKNKFVLVWMALVLVSMAAWVWTGCESAAGKDGIDIEPASVNLGLPNVVTNGVTNITSIVQFKAFVTDPLAFPLQWTVENNTMGEIIPGSEYGSNATYRAYSGVLGINYIRVRDQFGNNGVAVVKQ